VPFVSGTDNTNDTTHEVRTYRGWDGTSHTPTGPTEVTREQGKGVRNQ